MLDFLCTRQREPEWLDEPDTDVAELDKSLVYIRMVNRRMGYTRLILDRLREFSSSWKPGQTISVVDIGTGSADIPLAILKWAAEADHDVRVVGVDLNVNVLALAAEAAKDPRLSLVRGDAMNLPFEAGSFDYALTSMFLHHLDDDQAQKALAEMNRVARRGIIASDLLRLPQAYAFVWLATMFSRPIIRHDARVSVAQSFTIAEIQRLARAAGLEYATCRMYLGHRFVLSGEKSSMPAHDMTRSDAPDVGSASADAKPAEAAPPSNASVR